MSIYAALAIAWLLTLTSAEARDVGTDSCTHWSSPDETDQNYHDGLIVPKEPLSTPCPPVIGRHMNRTAVFIEHAVYLGSGHPISWMKPVLGFDTEKTPCG